METWLIYAICAAFFAALTTILAKIGIQDVNSHVATAIRTVVVLVFAWLMVLAVGSINEIGHVDGMTWIFLVLSGLSTGASWMCYFRALQLGQVRKVVPIDKSSTILTMLLAFLILGEPMGFITVIGMTLMGIGTWMMLAGNESDGYVEKDADRGHSWLIFAALAALFASLTAILGRIGIQNVEANLGNAIRTTAVLPMSFTMVFVTKSQGDVFKTNGRNWVFLLLSGLATGASWLLFYRALQVGSAIHVVPIDKLSVVLAMGFAALILRERFPAKSLIGLTLLTLGTLLPVIIIPSMAFK